ncbi:MAG: hypothetical protein KR126chlam1_00101 [Chlamydiae bacterium]|nr:hypothetical protein [Chlamydiota bacterium]
MFTSSSPVQGKTHFSLQQEIPLLVGSAAVAAVGSLGVSMVTSLSISPMELLGVGVFVYLASKVGQISYQKFCGPSLKDKDMSALVKPTSNSERFRRQQRPPRRAGSEASLQNLQDAVSEAQATLSKEKSAYLAAKERGEEGSAAEKELVRSYESRQAALKIPKLLLTVARLRSGSTAS